MFKITDVISQENDRVRLEVETDDASLFALVCVFESLVEFSTFFRHKMFIAQKIKDNDASRPSRMDRARVERHSILDAYGKLEGTRKEKLHLILEKLKGQGMDFLTLGGVNSMLVIARRERKEEKSDEHKKTA